MSFQCQIQCYFRERQGRPERVQHDAQMHHGQASQKTSIKPQKRKFKENRGDIYKFCGNRGIIYKFCGNRGREYAICTIGLGGWTPLVNKTKTRMKMNRQSFTKTRTMPKISH